MLGKLIDLLGNHLLALVVGTLLGSELTRFLYRPKVIIRLKGVQPLFSDGGFFLSVRVANTGRTVAPNSIGNVTIDYESSDLMDPDEYKLDKAEESLPTYRLENIKLDFPRHQLVTPGKERSIKNSSLCWSVLGNPQKVDINPGSNENLEICRVQSIEGHGTKEKFWYLIFPCEQGWRKVRCRIRLRNGVPLSGKIFICPSNVFPTVRKFQILCDESMEYPTLSIENYSLMERLYYFFNRSLLYFD